MTTITTSPYLQHFSSSIKQNMDWETLRNYNCGALHFTVLRTWKVILQIFTKTYCLSMCFKSLEKKIFCTIYHNQDPFFVVDQKNIFFSPWYFSYFFSGDKLTWLTYVNIKYVKSKYWNTCSNLPDFNKDTANYHLHNRDGTECMRKAEVTLKTQALRNVLWINQKGKTEKEKKICAGAHSLLVSVLILKPHFAWTAEYK